MLTLCCRPLPSTLMLTQTGCRLIGFNSTVTRQNSWLTTARSQHQLSTSGSLIHSTMNAPSSTVCDVSIFIMSTEQIDIPFFHWSMVGSHAIPVAGAKVWNNLPADVTSAWSIPIFNNRLETYLFHHCCQCTDISKT